MGLGDPSSVYLTTILHASSTLPVSLRSLWGWYNPVREYMRWQKHSTTSPQTAVARAPVHRRRQ
eukprot:1182692-Prorocentrum_minimum.AAC.3